MWRLRLGDPGPVPPSPPRKKRAKQTPLKPGQENCRDCPGSRHWLKGPPCPPLQPTPHQRPSPPSKSGRAAAGAPFAPAESLTGRGAVFSGEGDRVPARLRVCGGHRVPPVWVQHGSHQRPRGGKRGGRRGGFPLPGEFAAAAKTGRRRGRPRRPRGGRRGVGQAALWEDAASPVKGGGGAKGSWLPG